VAVFEVLEHLGLRRRKKKKKKLKKKKQLQWIL
jgi:hypothetical protein